jgi:hypothetical protein
MKTKSRVQPSRRDISDHSPLSCLNALIVASVFGVSSLAAFTKDGKNYLTDGSINDINAALSASADGDTVRVPAGNFTWGDGGSVIWITKRVTLAGAGQGSTNIQISSTAGTYGNGTIRILGAGTVRDMTIRGATGARTVFSTSGPSGWRITAITYLGVAGEGYFCYGGENYGVIDSCNITGGGGSSELIFTRGPTNSWQTPSSLGTTDAVYIEDCVFDGPGYVSDFNSNARGVVRFCTIKGNMKVDGHGVATNTPARGVRHMEVYRNRWTILFAYWTPVELRGGTGHIFDNQVTQVNWSQAWFRVREYGVLGKFPPFNWTLQTPVNYPILDQVGTGQDPRVGGSEPMYLWNNIDRDGKDWQITWDGIQPDCITLYRVQTGDPNATFTMDDIIKKDRDYFKHTVGATFNGSSGIGRGTKAQMLAIQASVRGVGFWVTDEADWNETNGAEADGQLYVWNGSAWTLKYTPLTYPHPLRNSGAPSNVKINVRVN